MLLKSSFLLVCAMSIAGCAGLGVGPKGVSLSEQNNTVVALDFVNALSGLRGHHPTNTMLQVRPVNSGFGRTLTRELRDAGYGLQTITEKGGGPMVVSYEADSFENSSFSSVAYRLRVGSVELGREYEIRAGRIFPISSLSVKGIEIASQTLDQSMFERIDDNLASSTGSNTFSNDRPAASSHGSASIVPVLTTPVPEKSPVTHASEELVRTTAVTGETSVVEPRHEEMQIRAQLKQNMLILGESNYASVFNDYRVVKQDVIVFPNDSMNLGRQGKRQIKQLFDTFNEQTDLISIVGCSHGNTNHREGNKALALGRAQRVIDELLAHRAPKDRLLDEGCWAGVTQKSLPSRGVVISVRRSLTAT